MDVNMKTLGLCHSHEAKLLESLEAAGLKPFIKDKEQMLEFKKLLEARLASVPDHVKSVSMEITPETYEPYIGAMASIEANGRSIILECGGASDLDALKAMTAPCVICFITSRAGNPEPWERWIEYATRDQINHAIRLGLMKPRAEA